MAAVRRLTCFQIDAFTPVPFGGNPAAVVLLPQSALPLSDSLRQQIAAEKNLSETAFLECVGDGDDFGACTRFKLRWFTPAIEVPLCGHATLAAAAAIFFGERNPAQRLQFDTLSGELVVTRQSAAGGAGQETDLLSMDLPAIEASSTAVPPGMEAVVKASVGDLAVQEVLYATQLKYLLVVLKDQGDSSRQAFLRLTPNSQQLGDAHTGGQLVGVIVTHAGDGQQHDVLSRFFAPWAGIAEDPVTGSAHSILGTFWAARLGSAAGRLRAKQCSPRGGELLLEVNQEQGRVVVAGQAVTVFEGSLLLPQV